MASTISITYKLQGNAKDLKALINDADGLKKAFNGAAVQAEQLPKKMGGLRSMAGSITKSLGGMAAGLVSVGALVKGLSSAINTMKDFEKANSELASVLGKSVSEINGLTESAMELGKRTSFTAAEVTSLQTSLARLGFTEGQITAMQESVLKFAAAVGTDLASAADFSGAALRSFGLKASDSQDLLNLMAASFSKSALSFSKLQTSISVVGPVANAFGLSARDTVAMLGVLSNAGFDASSAGAEGHYGMESMRRRTTELGGAMKVESSPGGGTRLSFSIPLSV
jgi:phage-related minor tail protein